MGEKITVDAALRIIFINLDGLIESEILKKIKDEILKESQ